MTVACQNCSRQFSEEQRASVKYHPDRICCPYCGSEKVVVFDEEEYEDAGSCY